MAYQLAPLMIKKYVNTREPLKILPCVLQNWLYSSKVQIASDVVGNTVYKKSWKIDHHKDEKHKLKIKNHKM